MSEVNNDTLVINIILGREFIKYTINVLPRYSIHIGSKTPYRSIMTYAIELIEKIILVNKNIQFIYEYVGI